MTNAYKSGETPLILAAQRGDLEKVTSLVAEGSNVNDRDWRGMVALHFAARNGHVEIATALLEAGASIEERDWQRWRPLHHAAARGHKNVVDMLLEKGCTVHLKTQADKTALEYAAEFPEIAAAITAKTN
eukprot:TRINITY_DN25909_c0_g1_i1.p1 TRINITY_DN25909_c0_g1~~TRINITY_DN25909_c0_g1_i1.p1  ORF type:complete len:130 (+),score=36.19 TRINITY_DN25909_c0_g1_i1:76-465(+)